MPNATWHSFIDAGLSVDLIIPTGNTMSVNVPYCYRVVMVTNSLRSELVYVPAGYFIAGCSSNELTIEEIEKGFPIDQHEEYVDAFYIGRYEVSKYLWDRTYSWAITNGYKYDNSGSAKAEDHPVQNINWYDCIKWCNARSEQEGLTPVYYLDADHAIIYKEGYIIPPDDCVYIKANGWRLPTEAEWEKAARGGLTNNLFPWDDSEFIDHDHANYYSRTNEMYDISSARRYNPVYTNGGTPFTSPIGSFEANGYGLYDISGNVDEWCTGLYGYSWRTNGTCVKRGGGWDNNAGNCRIFKRVPHLPFYSKNCIGFRLARTAN